MGLDDKEAKIESVSPSLRGYFLYADLGSSLGTGAGIISEETGTLASLYRLHRRLDGCSRVYLSDHRPSRKDSRQ